MSIEATFNGFIETTQDTLLIFEACRRGILPRICRRLQEKERKIVTSGSVFVFDERESGIKRWTDGLVWSPSRILGNFLIYRELDKRSPTAKKDSLQVERQRNNSGDMESQAEKNKERNLVGSLTNSYRFKKGGLIKKTMSIVVSGVAQHMISYYSKEDVLRNILKIPSQDPNLAVLEISPEFLSRQNFRIPPMIEGCDQVEPNSPTSPISQTSMSTSSSPVMALNSSCSCNHHPNNNNNNNSNSNNNNNINNNNNSNNNNNNSNNNNVGSPTFNQRMNHSHSLDYSSSRIKMEIDVGTTNNPGNEIYRSSTGFNSYATYPPHNGHNHVNNISDISNTLPVPSNMRGYLTSSPHRQSSYPNEFPPVTTANLPNGTPARILTSSPPPIMPTHHEYNSYYPSHVSNLTTSTNGWNDYQFSLPNGNNVQQQSSTHHPTINQHTDSNGNNELFYTTPTANHPNDSLPGMYNTHNANNFNDLPSTTLPELYNSASHASPNHPQQQLQQQQQQQQHNHHHHHQNPPPLSSSSPSPTMPSSSPPLINHHNHHQHNHSSSNGPITPPLSSANTIISPSGAGGASLFTSQLNYPSHYATVPFLKTDGYTATPAMTSYDPYIRQEDNWVMRI